MKRFILHFIQGAIVGVGAILPGVSGGILAVIFGIYEPLMELLTEPLKTFKKHYKLFVPFGVGWLLGFLLLARATERLFAFAPDVATFLFFGLVFGSLPSLFNKTNRGNWLPFVISLAASFVFFHLFESGITFSTNVTFWSFVLCGVLWGLSLIIPGFCSATLLICLDIYVPFADGVASLDFGVIIPFLIGVVTVVLLCARFVNMLFKKHYKIMSKIVLGFVISSSLVSLPTCSSPLSLVISIVCGALGFLVALKMDKE